MMLFLCCNHTGKLVLFVRFWIDGIGCFIPSFLGCAGSVVTKFNELHSLVILVLGSHTRVHD